MTTIVERKSSSTICNDARGMYPVATRGQSPRIGATVVLNPCCEQACMICLRLGRCEKSRSLLREGGGRANENINHNEPSGYDNNFHALLLMSPDPSGPRCMIALATDRSSATWLGAGRRGYFHKQVAA